MLTLKEIHDKIYNDPSHQNYRVFISLYEENKLLIESTEITIDKEAAHIVIQLMSDYALALSNSGSYKNAIEYFNKVIPLFEVDSKFYNQDPFKIPLYESLIWGRARTFHYLKEYNNAAMDLKKLIANFPDNDMYRYWLRSTTAHKINKIGIICWILTMLGIMCSYIPSKGSSTIIVILCFTITFFGTAITIEIIKYILQSKK